MGFGSMGENIKLSRASQDFGYADMSMSMTGFVELDAMFNELTDKSKKRVLVKGMREAIEPVKERVTRFTPKHTGRLRESIHLSKKFNASTGFAEARLGFRTRGGKGAPHAHLVEWGTAERQTPVTRFTILGNRKSTGEVRQTGRMKKQLNMTRAFKQAGGSRHIKNKFREILNETIIKAHKRSKNKRQKFLGW